VKESLEKQDVARLEQSDAWVHPATKKRTEFIINFPPLGNPLMNQVQV